MAPPQSKKRRISPVRPAENAGSGSEESTGGGGVALSDASLSDDADEFDLDAEVSSSTDGDSSSDDDDDDDDISTLLSTAAAVAASKKRKRNDPAAFSATMSKLLSSHLTTTARQDPILVRAKKFQQNIDASKLDAKARRLLRDEKRAALDKGRVRDVTGGGGGGGLGGGGGGAGDEAAVGRALEYERVLRKTAQRGVVKLFNAVRAAQIRGEEAEREGKRGGVVGIVKRGEKVTEMSKQGFLELIQAGGTKEKK